MKQIVNMSAFGGKQSSIAKATQISAIVLTGVLALAPFAFAQTGFQLPSGAGSGLPNDNSVSGFVIKIINIALAVAGLIAVLFLIIGGFRYITSAGNEETAEQAKKIITNAIIGIVVIILSFVIVRVISNALVSNQV